MNFQYEIIKSIQNIFESNLSTKAISEETKVSYTTINELRNKKRDIYSTSVENCQLLYDFAVAHKLNQEVLNLEKRKGTYDSMDLPIYLQKVAVAFNRLDLFSMGLMVIENSDYKFIRDKLVQLKLSKSVFITENKKIYSTNEFGKCFECNYYSCDYSNDFVEFVEQYSKIDKNIIRGVIYENEIVIHDFRNDKIYGSKSNTDLDGITLNKYNSKLIITIEKYNLECCADKIEIVTSILNEHYGKDTNLKRISYIYDYESDDTQKYNVNKNSILDTNGMNYRIILEYDAFEIWIPYANSESNDFDVEIIKKFIIKLGIKSNDMTSVEDGFQKLSKENVHRKIIVNVEER